MNMTTTGQELPEHNHSGRELPEHLRDTIAAERVLKKKKSPTEGLSNLENAYFKSLIEGKPRSLIFREHTGSLCPTFHSNELASHGA